MLCADECWGPDGCREAPLVYCSGYGVPELCWNDPCAANATSLWTRTPGRVGESLSAVGVVVEVAGLLANSLVASCNSVLINSGLFDPLWIYYPIGGLITLCALVPLAGTPSGGWGAGSIEPVGKLIAIVYAHRAQAKWRRRIEYGVNQV